MDFARFIGMDYEPKGRGPLAFDCWGFVMLVSREIYRHPLPDYGTTYQDSDNLSDAAFAMWGAVRNNFWQRVDPEPGDIVQFRIGRFICHVGILVGPDLFLHCLRGRGSAMENLSAVDWRDRFIGGWRYAG